MPIWNVPPSGTSSGWRVTAAKAKVRGGERQLPQQVEHVGLLTGAVAAKHISVEQNHTSSS